MSHAMPLTLFAEIYGRDKNDPGKFVAFLKARTKLSCLVDAMA
jgi:hypothetical protein